MNKKTFFASFLVIIVLVISFSSTDSLKSSVLKLSNKIKSNFIYIVDSINFEIHTWFNQRETIYELNEKVKKLEPMASLSVAYATKLNNFLKDVNLSTYNPKMHLTRAISYVNIEDPYKLWLEFNEFDKDRIYGLLYRGYSVGIVKQHYGQALAVLHMSKECKYSVYIGDQKTPGILFGNEPFMKVKYIPLYADVKVGDKVVTSGFDEIFFEGIKVGEVVQIQKDEIYKMAFVKPFVKVKKPSFFYAIDIKK